MLVANRFFYHRDLPDTFLTRNRDTMITWHAEAIASSNSDSTHTI